jgi:putative peptidoglycan lipid II flippase
LDKSHCLGDDFFNYTFWWFIFTGIGVAVVLFIFSKYIIGFYLSSIPNDLQKKGYQIFLLFLLTVPINAGVSVITAYMQSNFNFIYPIISQLVLNLIVIVLIIILTSTFSIYILPLSFLTAYLFVFFMLLKPVSNKLKFIPANIFRKKFHQSDFNILISLIFIEGFSLSYVLVDRYFIGTVPEGGIAALNYAFVIYLLPVTVFSIPLITTMFSKFSQLVTKSNETLHQDFMSASRINIYVIIPSLFVIYFWGDFFLKLFYERGAFKSTDTDITYTALKYYSLSLVFYSTYLIVVKLLYSLNEYYKVLIISIIAFLLKVLFNFLFIGSMEQNGLALSTSLIYLFLFVTGFYLGNNQLKLKKKLFHIGAIIYFLINGVIAYLVSNFIILLIQNNSYLSYSSGIAIFILVYIINSFFLDDNEYIVIKETIVKILPFNRFTKPKHNP